MRSHKFLWTCKLIGSCFCPDNKSSERFSESSGLDDFQTSSSLHPLNFDDFYKYCLLCLSDIPNAMGSMEKGFELALFKSTRLLPLYPKKNLRTRTTTAHFGHSWLETLLPTCADNHFRQKFLTNCVIHAKTSGKFHFRVKFLRWLQNCAVDLEHKWFIDLVRS